MRSPEYLPLILEPHSRMYVDPVIVLDFQSLYPTMMIAYNYCFSTCLGRVEHLGQYESYFICKYIFHHHLIMFTFSFNHQGTIHSNSVHLSFACHQNSWRLCIKMICCIYRHAGLYSLNHLYVKVFCHGCYARYSTRV